MISKKIQKELKGIVDLTGNKVNLLDEKAFADKLDSLVYDAVFGIDEDKLTIRWIIWEVAQSLGIQPASIHDFYIARGREELPLDFTVPAVNVQGYAYDMAQSMFRVANRLNVGALIFEIARSEMGYGNQSPLEYATVILGSAIKTGWRGPVFLQGDHIQTKAASPGVPKEGEVETIKKIIKEALSYGFYNIDIDTSTLVDLDQPTEAEQQAPNIKTTVEVAKFIREHEPKGITVSIGGEIGHIGGVNSTVEDFEAYLTGVNAGLPKNMTGLSKISIQTGTSHGGVVLPDGTLADINVDFQVLLNISRECRKNGLGGAVQHGASTLPDRYFEQFVKSEAVEVHLATGFRNIIMDNTAFPAELLQKIYDWLDSDISSEKKPGWTDEQFRYKLRKYGWGRFKKEIWDIPAGQRAKINKDLEKRFTFLFKKLNVVNTKDMVNKIIKPVTTHKKLEDFSLDTVTSKVINGLSD